MEGYIACREMSRGSSFFYLFYHDHKNPLYGSFQGVIRQEELVVLIYLKLLLIMEISKTYVYFT